MKIGIYSESTRGTADIGGSELIVVTLAEALKDAGHSVEVIHHDRLLTADTFRERFDVPSELLKLRYAPLESNPNSVNPWRRHLEEERWYRNLSIDYDIFIEVAHHKPPICRTAKGILYVLFPFYAASDLWSPSHDPSPGRHPIMKVYRRWYHRWSWNRRMRSYSLKASISQFSQRWTRQRWGIETQVIYPPPRKAVRRNGGGRAKRDVILSVGRFAGAGVSKNQMEMLTAFRLLTADRFETWQYRCVGGLGPSPDDLAYFQKAQALTEGVNAVVQPNVDAESLAAYYNETKVFWHATGLGEDEQARPEMCEHYGIATVEAMLAGCVPVVINRGAQPEIIEHGVNGFLWNTTAELNHYTTVLMTDEALRREMAMAAQQRAQSFTREKFIKDFLEFAQPLLHAG